MSRFGLAVRRYRGTSVRIYFGSPFSSQVVVCGHCDFVWPSGKALLRLVSRGTSVRIYFGSPFSSQVVVCGHCLVTLSLTIIMKH